MKKLTFPKDVSGTFEVKFKKVWKQKNQKIISLDRDETNKKWPKQSWFEETLCLKRWTRVVTFQIFQAVSSAKNKVRIRNISGVFRQQNRRFVP